MTKYNPLKHHRQSIRLKGYDYFSSGFYYVTICVNNRENIFGDVVGEVVLLSKVGVMVNYWWCQLSKRFNNVVLSEYIIMPNHIHGIINIVGADQCVRPCLQEGAHTGAPLYIHTFLQSHMATAPDWRLAFSYHLQRIIQWFKVMTTNDYIQNVKENNWRPFFKRLWQRGYYDRILRNNEEMDRVIWYMKDNPKNWEEDPEYL